MVAGDGVFAVCPSEAGGAVAGVGALTGVETGAVVATGFVVGAVVEILVAEQSSPAFVAQAVPRLHTTAVHATGIAFAFVTQRSNPTCVTTEIKKKYIYKKSFFNTNNENKN